LSLFLDIIDQHARTDQNFVEDIQDAIAASDDAAFDAALECRSRNDQAYFLYMFTRLETVINDSFKVLLTNRSVGDWDIARPWLQFSEQKIQKIPLLVIPAVGQEMHAIVSRFHST